MSVKRRTKVQVQLAPARTLLRAPKPAEVRALAIRLGAELRPEVVAVAALLEMGGTRGEHVQLVAEALGLAPSAPIPAQGFAGGYPLTPARLRLARTVADLVATALVTSDREAWGDLAAVQTAQSSSSGDRSSRSGGRRTSSRRTAAGRPPPT